MLSLISSEFLVKNTISLSSSIISNINYIRTYKVHDDELDKIFVECDILSDIGIIKTYIDEHNYERAHSPSYKSSVQNLNETLFYLENEITKLTMKVKNHHEKWFAYYRSYDITSEKKRIFILIKQMNHRFDMLIKIQ